MEKIYGEKVPAITNKSNLIYKDSVNKLIFSINIYITWNLNNFFKTSQGLFCLVRAT